MIIFKKASPEDLHDIILAIMRLRDNNGKAITEPEAIEFIDHCYYAYDDTLCSIVAVIAAYRETLNEFSEVEGSMISVHPNRYKIKYMVGDDFAIEEYAKPYTLQSVMVYLVRELTHDMNDWSVWVDTDDVYIGEEYHDKACYRALRTNYFAQSLTEPTTLIRAMPINFDALH